mgnify:CR=1 FL=1
MQVRTGPVTGVLSERAFRDRIGRLPDGTWALTPEGVAWLEQDRELSGP